ncbi:hypothetical protein D3C76_1317010 [compost metagenome]
MQAFRKTSSASTTKYIVFLSTFATFVISHVLYHTQQLMLGLNRHCTRSRGYKCCCCVRRCHDDLLALWQHLMHVQSYVTCAWRQIKQHVVQFSPIYICKELTQHATQHGTTPDHRVIFTNEKSHRHHFYTKTLDRLNDSILHNRVFFNPHHIRYTETIDVRIN